MDVGHDSQHTVQGDDELQAKKVIFQSTSSIARIIASFWIVFLLGFPLWWSTTSIERLPIPVTRVQQQQLKKISLPVEIVLGFDSVLFEPQLFASQLKTHFDVLLGGDPTFTLKVDLSALPNEHQYQVIVTNETSSTIQGKQLRYGVASQTLTTVPQQLASFLYSSLFQSSQDFGNQRVIQYSPRYRVAFSLFNEDGAANRVALDWDIRSSIARHITPSLKWLSALHNFTIESHVQVHAPLAFEPVALNLQEESADYGLTQEQLTVFVNSEQWTLSSGVSNDPVLHFILFIPSPSRRSLRILDSQGNPTSSQSFILPQWGGIYIYNPPNSADARYQLQSEDLSLPFSVFRKQLLALLGVQPLPQGLVSTSLTDWQLEALIRRRIVETTRGSTETLSSIVKLVDQIDGMPLGKDVVNDIQDALDALEKVPEAVSSRLAITYSSKAFTLASRAFFNPGMLALLYFPTEHTIAVYTPMFAPMAIPLIASVIREYRAWRKRNSAPTITS